MLVWRPSITHLSLTRGGPGHCASAISALEMTTERSPWTMPLPLISSRGS